MSERGTSCTEPRRDVVVAAAAAAAAGTSSAAPRRLARRREGNVQVRVNGRRVPQLDMLFSSRGGVRTNGPSSSGGGLNLFGSVRGGGGSGGGGGGGGDEPNCRFVDGDGLRPPTEALNALLSDDGQVCYGDDGGVGGGGSILRYGRNLIRYTLLSGTDGAVVVSTAEAHLYLWRSRDSVIVSDVDGTVTKSDVRGVIDTLFQDKFQHVHDGICKFYHALMDAGNDRRNERDYCGGGGGGEDGSDYSRGGGAVVGAGGEVRFLYLSSRPIIFVNQTRKLLVRLSQTCPSRTEKNYGLPPGPVMCHTGPLSSVLYSELVAKNIYQFKADVLARQLVLPFVSARGEVVERISKPPPPPSRGRAVSFEGPSENINGDAKDEVADPAPEYLDGDATEGFRPLQNFRSFSGMSDASSVWDDRLFLAGFGNKITDAMAYEMAGIDRSDIYIIDKESRIVCMGEKERNNGSSRSITSGVLAQSERFFAGEESCAGGVDRQLTSEPSAPAHVDRESSSSSNTNKAAMTIHSIELSLTERRRCESLDSFESPGLFTTATTVDIYATSEKERGSKSATSKWSKVKQSIRPFSTKKNSFSRFPSLGLTASSGGSEKSSSKKIIYRGYDDPLLLVRIRERMVG